MMDDTKRNRQIGEKSATHNGNDSSRINPSVPLLCLID